MNITQQQLRHLRDAPIECVEIVSLEGRCYIARFFQNGTEYMLTDNKDHARRFNGASCVREAFEHEDVRRFEVLPPAGTDEMIGMPTASPDETMRAPL